MAVDFETMLERNLAYLRWLTERVVEAGTPERRGPFVREYAKALERHLGAIEEIVVPDLQAHGADGSALASLPAHAALRPELAELSTGSLEDAALGAPLLRFLERTSEHLQREALALIPLVHAHLGEPSRLALGDRLQAHLDIEASCPT